MLWYRSSHGCAERNGSPANASELSVAGRRLWGIRPLYEGVRIIEAACWAHARRRFNDIFAASQSPTASEAIRRIGELYAIEKEVRGSPLEIRLAT